MFLTHATLLTVDKLWIKPDANHKSELLDGWMDPPLLVSGSTFWYSKQAVIACQQAETSFYKT